MKKKTKGAKKVAKVMREYKGGKLKSGSGAKVKSRKQAIAIALSEAGKKGASGSRRQTLTNLLRYPGGWNRADHPGVCEPTWLDEPRL